MLLTTFMQPFEHFQVEIAVEVSGVVNECIVLSIYMALKLPVEETKGSISDSTPGHQIATKQIRTRLILIEVEKLLELASRVK